MCVKWYVLLTNEERETDAEGEGSARWRWMPAKITTPNFKPITLVSALLVLFWLVYTRMRLCVKFVFIIYFLCLCASDALCVCVFFYFYLDNSSAIPHNIRIKKKIMGRRRKYSFFAHSCIIGFVREKVSNNKVSGNRNIAVAMERRGSWKNVIW